MGLFKCFKAQLGLSKKKRCCCVAEEWDVVKPNTRQLDTSKLDRQTVLQFNINISLFCLKTYRSLVLIHVFDSSEQKSGNGTKKEQDTWSEISKTSGLFVAQDELRAHQQQICWDHGNVPWLQIHNLSIALVEYLICLYNLSRSGYSFCQKYFKRLN